MQIAVSPTVTAPSRAHRPLERSHCTVILASGAADGGKRATLAFAAALTAASMEQDTLLFLVGDGAWWGYEGRGDGVRVPGFPALDELIESFVDAGGRVVLCSACDAVCSLPSEADSAVGAPPKRLPSVRLQGLASVLAHSATGSSLTF